MTQRPHTNRRGFTLIELLTVLGIISVLMSISAVAIGRVIGAARGVKCQITMRDVATSFQHFASDEFNHGRGDDRTLGRKFRLATFQDSQYQVDEFWNWGSDTEWVQLPTAEKDDPMRCAEVHGEISLRRGIECIDGAISPAQRMSYGFNRRLHREEYTDQNNRVRTRQVFLTSEIMQVRNLPLMWDVDAEAAGAANTYPGFSAPSLDSRGAYAGNRFWYPGRRHNGNMNVTFTDGHVESTDSPLELSSWNWAYQFGARR